MNFTPDFFSGARSLMSHSIDLENVSKELLDLNCSWNTNLCTVKKEQCYLFTLLSFATFQQRRSERAWTHAHLELWYQKCMILVIESFANPFWTSCKWLPPSKKNFLLQFPKLDFKGSSWMVRLERRKVYYPRNPWILLTANFLEKHLSGTAYL